MDALVVVAEELDELDKLELLVGSDDDDSVVEVRTAGPGIVVTSSSSLSSLLSPSFGSGVAVGSAGPSSESVAVGVGSMLKTLVTKLPRGSRICRSSSGIARTPCNKIKDKRNTNRCLIIVTDTKGVDAGDALPDSSKQ